MILPFVTFIIMNAKISVYFFHILRNTRIQPDVVLAH